MSEVIIDESCGNGLGSIDLTVTGGNSLTFIWDSGETVEDLSNLSAGTYTYTVLDGLTGCTYSQSVNVANTTTGITVSSVSANELCGDGAGSINLTVSGGTGSYSYLWTPLSGTSEDLSA